MARVKFTAGRIEGFQCEQGKSQSFLWDTTAPGLGLRATATGAKAFIFQAKLNGQAIRITIGAPATWTIDDAQVEARRLKVIFDSGRDPRQVNADALIAEQAARDLVADEAAAKQKQVLADKARREIIARDAWDTYLKHPRPATGKRKWGDQHRADHEIAAATGGTDAKIGKRILKPGPLAELLAQPLHSITATVVQEWLTRECASRPTFAHNAYRKFRTFIRWCMTQPNYRDVVQADCCTADEVKNIVPSSKTKEGDSLRRVDLQEWFYAVRKIDNTVISAYLQALLITGARRGEIALMKWTDIDFRRGEITIRDKIEGTRVIPLTPFLSQLLEHLPRRNVWVFSSPSAKSGHITEPRLAHTRALKAAGLPHISLHGLRRSFATLAEWTETPAGIAAQIQGHKPQGVRETNYIRRPIDLLRMWHVKIEAWMLEQAKN